MTQARTDAEARCIRDVVHFLNTGDLRGVLHGLAIRDGLQSDLQQAFGLIVAQDVPLPPAVRARLEKQAARVLLRRVATDPVDRMPIWHFGFRAVEEIASFQALEIWNAQLRRGFPGDLCRCKHCAVFFFSSDRSSATGRRRTDFCRDECLEEHQKKTGADRKAASRAGMSIVEWRKTQAGAAAAAKHK